MNAGEEQLVVSYLFDAMPGITAVAYFRGAESFDDCLSILAATAPSDMRRRLGLQDMNDGEHVAGSIAVDEDLSPIEIVEQYLQAERTQREQFLATWVSPLRVLNMTGWRFLLPEDINYLVQAYTSHAYEDIDDLISVYASDWDAIVSATHINYDVAIALDDGVAFP
ncbi:MAG: hypothetical protein MI924_33845 [Chloroflexales bacterium]|nr:hypothetical protein [Chloroflexales bacterium]